MAWKLPLDSAGRVVIPKAARERAGLRAGMKLDVAVRGGVVELAPALPEVKVLRRDALVVLTAPKDAPTPGCAQVRETLREHREERHARAIRPKRSVVGRGPDSFSAGLSM